MFFYENCICLLNKEDQKLSMSEDYHQATISGETFTDQECFNWTNPQTKTKLDFCHSMLPFKFFFFRKLLIADELIIWSIIQSHS